MTEKDIYLRKNVTTPRLNRFVAKKDSDEDKETTISVYEPSISSLGPDFIIQEDNVDNKCVWCGSDGYDEIDYIEELLNEDARKDMLQMGMVLRNRFNYPECDFCASKNMSLIQIKKENDREEENEIKESEKADFNIKNDLVSENVSKKENDEVYKLTDVLNDLYGCTNTYKNTEVEEQTIIEENLPKKLVEPPHAVTNTIYHSYEVLNSKVPSQFSSLNDLKNDATDGFVVRNIISTQIKVDDFESKEEIKNISCESENLIPKIIQVSLNKEIEKNMNLNEENSKEIMDFKEENIISSAKSDFSENIVKESPTYELKAASTSAEIIEKIDKPEAIGEIPNEPIISLSLDNKEDKNISEDIYKSDFDSVQDSTIKTGNTSMSTPGYVALGTSVYPVRNIEEIISSNKVQAKINKFFVDKGGEIIKITPKEKSKKKNEVSGNQQKANETKKNVENDKKIQKEEKLIKKATGTLDKNEEGFVIMKEAESRVSGPKTPKYENTKSDIRRFVFNRKSQQYVFIESVDNLNDLRSGSIVGKIQKRGKNGRYQLNWFNLRGNFLTCLNGKRYRACASHYANERDGDLVCPEDSNFFYTKKYSINILECKILIVKNHSFLNSLLTCPLKFYKKRNDDLIDITDSKIISLNKQFSNYNILINNGNEEFAVKIPILEFALECNGAFYFFRFDNSTIFLRWLLSISMRQGNIICKVE
ncbi:hypothetical protein CWI36_0700p0020 [Hamiltosporidium magnivora]|uniref:PH domain-containing protein n=1 Tax=Hamiltosporidium magnivora TaxID=148818 RepID=A0A4Q9LCW6_9MICR|nr:hypothetical protein CWI36_0700p0020 [Hamiltosporidium magnivora]